MGVDLKIITNHNFQYNPKNKAKTAKEICDFFDNNLFPHEDLVEYLLSVFYEHDKAQFKNLKNQKTTYHIYDEEMYYNEELDAYEDSGISISTRYGLNIEIVEDYVELYFPIMRWYKWYLIGNKYFIDKWKVFLRAFTKWIGGDTILIMDDHIIQFLPVFIHKVKFKAIYKALNDKYSESKNEYYTSFEVLPDDMFYSKIILS